VLELAGAWRLVSYRIERSAGGSTQPLGPDPAGLLVYGPGDAMSVQMMRRGRPAFAVLDPRRGTPGEVAAAFGGYLAYAGTFEVHADAGFVVHRIEIAWFPNWEGSEQKRFFELAGDRLTLRSPPWARSGVTSAGVLVWERFG